MHERKVETSSNYIDGGVFNNQPVGLAIALGNMIDRTEPQPGERVYFFIDAHKNTTDFQDDNNIGNLSDPFHLLKRLASIIHPQSRASDYLASLQINQQLSFTDQLYTSLERMVESMEFTGNDEITNLTKNLAGLAHEVFNMNQDIGVSFQEHLNVIVSSRLNLGNGIQNNNYPEERKRILEYCVYIFDNLSVLQDRHNAKIFLLHRGNNALAGEMLGWFGGFFDRNYRIYNFYKGRQMAQDALLQININGQPLLCNYNNHIAANYGVQYQADLLNDNHVPVDLANLPQVNWEHFPKHKFNELDPSLTKRLSNQIVEFLDPSVVKLFKYAKSKFHLFSSQDFMDAVFVRMVLYFLNKPCRRKKIMKKLVDFSMRDFLK